MSQLVQSLPAATGYARFAARYQPVPTGRSVADIAAGRVIQVAFGKRSTRMSPLEARDFAARLMARAAKDPTVGLVVEYWRPGAKHPYRVKLTQADIRHGVESIYAAVRAAGKGAAP